MSHMLCFGLGYTARFLARRMSAQGWRISGTSRTAEGVAAVAAEGWGGLHFDGTEKTTAVSAALASATHVLLSIPPDAAGDTALRHHGPDLAAAPHLAWIGYLSTIGVYGDHQGGAVDEETPPSPATDRGRRRLAAELEWLAFPARTGKRVEIFRLPGIYGPGRSALDAVRAGSARRIVKPGQMFNRVHVADIAAALEAAFTQPHRHAVYNVTDDEPAPPEDVIAYAAKLLGAPLPPAIAFEDAELSAMARSFYGESKRVSNRRLKLGLGLKLAYPSYREGLAAIVGGLS